MILLSTLVLVAGLTVSGQTIGQDPASASVKKDTLKKAPNFSAKATDGKTYSLKSLTKDNKTLVLYFIGNTCPINMEAAPFFNQIAKAYKGKVNFVGVVDSDKATFDEWNEEFKVPYKVLLDPELKIIKSYKAIASPWVIVVKPNGDVEKIYEGYSAATLQVLSDQMAKHAKMKPVKINTKGASEWEMAG